MKRYDIVGQWEEQESEFGDWVEQIEANARIAELTAEVDKARHALLKIREVSFTNDSNEDYGVIYKIARNALKEG